MVLKFDLLRLCSTFDHHEPAPESTVLFQRISCCNLNFQWKGGTFTEFTSHTLKQLSTDCQNFVYLKILPSIGSHSFPVSPRTLMLLGALLSWPRLLSFQSKPRNNMKQYKPQIQRSKQRFQQANRAPSKPMQTSHLRPKP